MRTHSMARSQQAVVLLVTLIGTIGIALPYPVLSPLFLDSQEPIRTFAGIDPYWLLGISLAVYPLGVLLGASILGSLSDRVGRKPVLTITLFVAALTNGLSAYSLYLGDYILFILARGLTGVLEGNISVARAVITDLGDQIDKTRAFSYVSAASFAGWFIGPLLGGYTVEYGYSTPFFLAALLCLLGALYVQVSFVETASLTPVKRLSSSLKFWQTPGLKRFIMIQCMVMFAINIFYEFYPVYLVTAFQASPETIADATMICTLAMVLTSVWVVPRLFADHDQSNQTLRERYYAAGCVLSGVSFWLVISPSQQLNALMTFLVCGGAIALLNSVAYAWFSDRFSTLNQGRLMGVLVATFCMANVLAAVLGSVMARFDVVILLSLAGVIAVLSGVYYWYVVTISDRRVVSV